VTRRHRITWSQKADAALVAGFRAGKTIEQLAAAIPGHPHPMAVKQRISRLRKAGADLPIRKRAPNSAEAQRECRRAQVRAAKARFDMRRESPPQPATPGWPVGAVFADDPRALAEAGFVARIVPAPSAWASPIGSTASLAVR